MGKPIYVTRPSLPSLDEYVKYLHNIWKSGILTHNGPLVQKLEKELNKYLNTKNMVAVVNGTTGIQLAIKAMSLNGEIITTPFTWVATISAIMWENCRPIFVDVKSDTFNIDPEKIEEAISKETCAILGVHVFSNPCDIEKISEIAEKYNLKVIYDAAHAMCVNYKGRSIMEYGDVSATSFHATKIFQSGEGGGCVTLNDEFADRIRRIRFFGYDENKDIVDQGINGKMTEIHAALGLSNLKMMDEILFKRRKKYELYQRLLRKCDFVDFQIFPKESYNYSYMPILLKDESQLIKTVNRLQDQNIFPRRYFFPALNTIESLFPNYNKFSIAENLSKRIICLPLYDDLSNKEIERICQIIKK